MENQAVKNAVNVESEEYATLTMGERAAYGVGDFASNMMFGAVNAFMTYFFTNISGISAAVVGTILLVSRLFDGFSDLIVGIGMEKVHSKHGKARPWLLWFAVPFGVSLALLFTAPDFSMKGKIIYAFLTYNLATTVMFTAINLPFGSLAPLLTKNQYERGMLNISKMIFAFLGGLVITTCTLPLVSFFGGGAKGWQMTFIIFGAVSIFFFLFCFRHTKERVGANVSEEEKEDVDIKEVIKSLPKNKYWVILLGLFFIHNFAVSVAGVNVYYAEYILGNPDLVGTFSMYETFAALATFAVLSIFIKKFGKRNTALGGTILSLIACGILLLNSTSLAIVYLSFILKGIGKATVMGTMYGMLADTIEYSEWKTGMRAEGLIFSANSIGIKVGQGLGSATLGWGLALIGFVANKAGQSAATLGGIQFMFLKLPILLFILQLIVLMLYKLDNEYDVIVAELKERKKANA